MKFAAVVPTISRSLRALEELASGLEDAGLKVLFVSNAAETSRLLENTDLHWVTNHNNQGFAASVNWGFGQLPEQDYVVICNDDVTVCDSSKLRATLVEAVQHADIVYGDPAGFRRIPQMMQVFLICSLLSQIPAVREALIDAKDDVAYKSFSFVAISSVLFEQLRGLDESIPFTFEDADFISRALRVGASTTSLTSGQLAHRHSVATKRTIATTLPVHVASARIYLLKMGHKRTTTSLVLQAAMVLRLFLLFASASSRQQHILGTMRGMRAAWGRPYSLAAYDSI